MSEKDVVQGQRSYYTDEGEYNRLRFVIEQVVREMLNTAALVRVDAVDGGGVAPAGTVSATPLVAQTDALGNVLPMVPIPRLPFFRYQAGKAAIILDPVAGDQGLAVFLKKDSSTVGVGTTEPQRPGSFREFDQSDGVVIGGVQNQAPTVWIEVKQDETITIHAPAGVKIETDASIDMVAGVSVNVTAPQIALNGALSMQSATGGATTAILSGTMNATQDVTASGISLNSHTHSGVEPGGGSSGGPQ